MLVETKFGEIIHRKPVAYQRIGGKKKEVESEFKRLKMDIYGFELGEYSQKYELIIDPILEYSTFIGGEKSMLVWNDLDADEKIKVYDKGVKVENKKGIHNLLVSYRSGDMWSPKVEQTEALKAEADYFVDCVLNDKTPFNDGHAGLRVVKMLEASNESLKREGKMVKL